MCSDLCYFAKFNEEIFQLNFPPPGRSPQMETGVCMIPLSTCGSSINNCITSVLREFIVGKPKIICLNHHNLPTHTPSQLPTSQLFTACMQPSVTNCNSKEFRCVSGPAFYSIIILFSLLLFILLLLLFVYLYHFSLIFSNSFFFFYFSFYFILFLFIYSLISPSI